MRLNFFCRETLLDLNYFFKYPYNILFEEMPATIGTLSHQRGAISGDAPTGKC